MIEQAIHTGDVGCQCSACAGSYDPFLYAELDASADPDAGGTATNGKPIWSVDDIAFYLNRTGAGWTGAPGEALQSDTNLAEIEFGFHTSQTSLRNNGYVFAFNGGLFGLPEFFNFAPFSEAQKAAAREAIASWDDLVSVSFVERPINEADIAFGNLASAPTTQAYAYLPLSLLSGNPIINAQVQDVAGDVWISLSQASNLQLDFGYYGLITLVHEIGHAIGLSHPGAYNAAPGTVITYPVNAEYYQDSRQYTVMSYFNAEFTGGGHVDWSRLNWVYAQTPLVHDIAAIQAIYGADPTTRAGDTVYGFNSTAGKDVYDFAINDMPVLAIYDAAGVDTLDFSGWNSNSIIDLNPGAFSSGGGSGIVPLADLKAAGLLPETYTEEQYLDFRTRYNAADGLLHDNISIAYGTILENAVGGGGDDLLIGNAVANRLAGGAGDDYLIGGGGWDYLEGGLGADTFRAENDTAKLASKVGAISLEAILDFAKGQDKIDLTGIDARTGGEWDSFTFKGTDNGKNAGDLFYKVYTSVNGAEKALGIDLDGVDGASPYEGPVTLVYGNVDGGTQDFALVLFKTDGVTLADFIFLDESAFGEPESAVFAFAASSSAGMLVSDMMLV